MIYFDYLKMHIKSSFQYRLSMLFLTITQAIVSVGELIGVWFLFKQFKTVGPWGFYDICFMYGMIMTAFPLTECFARGFDHFPILIRTGGLDRILIRPRGVFLQVLGSEYDFSKLGRSLISFIALVVGLCNMAIAWSFIKVLVIIAMFFCACMIVFGLIIVSAGISIFTVENLEFLNILTDGGKEISQYPLSIYGKYISKFFTYVIPLACFNYLPMNYLLGTGSLPPFVYAICPLIGMLFFVPCYFFFRWSLTKYKGTGT